MVVSAMEKNKARDLKGKKGKNLKRKQRWGWVHAKSLQSCHPL